MALTGNAVWCWIVNHHLIHSRLNCHYANCSTLFTSFDCKFMTSNRSLLAEATNKKCWHILQDHRLHHANKTTNYTCILTRRKRREEKHITIDYSICRGKSKYITHIFKKMHRKSSIGHNLRPFAPRLHRALPQHAGLAAASSPCCTVARGVPVPVEGPQYRQLDDMREEL